MKVDLIAGARPNFVKIAALIHAQQSSTNKILFRLIHTGQHYDQSLSGSFFEQLEIPEPNINLRVGSGSQAEQTAAIMVAYEKVLQKEKPDLCIVVGDVNSSLACAVTAKKMQVKLAHVEAGIRSGDWSMPEEVNRVLIDSIADLFFTTSRSASNNLLSGGVPVARVHFVGNTMIDTLLKFRSSFMKPAVWEELNLKELNYIVVTLHRPANVDEEQNLQKVLEQIVAHSCGLPLIFPVHPRTAKVLEKLGTAYVNLHLIHPLSYLEFNYLVENSKAVITDSGGISEETTVLKVPCMTIRNNTERPETIRIGTNELLGTNPTAIAPALHKLFSGKWKEGAIPERWDGKAAKRIVEIIDSF